MPNKKISQLTALTAVGTNDADQLVIVDADATETKKMTVAEAKILFGGGGGGL